MRIDADWRGAVSGVVREHPRWFIYYRIHPDDRAAVMAAVCQFQAELRQRWPGLTTELLCRTPDASGLHTLMEIYAFTDAPPPAGPGLAWPACIEQAAGVLNPWLQGERHVETFLPCA